MEALLKEASPTQQAVSKYTHRLIELSIELTKRSVAEMWPGAAQLPDRSVLRISATSKPSELSSRLESISEAGIEIEEFFHDPINNDICLYPKL
jgi:hypothetical protein